MSRNASLRRLYVNQPLGDAQRVPLTRDQAHYLFNVMRLNLHDRVILFNGADGEWEAEVAEAGKKGGTLLCAGQTRQQSQPPDLWLLFAPIRKERMAFVVEKAVELGAARIVPVQTDFTQGANRVRQDKLQAIAVEAAEQCEALCVPPVAPLEKLKSVLAGWDPKRRILFCDEALAEAGAENGGQDLRALAQASTENAPWAILIGPEGGFSEAEKEKLIRPLGEIVHPISLGPRILRAETAAIAAMTLWQSQLGDWS